MDVLLDSARASARMLHSLLPARHAAEFEHYRLMADIRVYYLSYLVIEGKVNSAGSVAGFQRYAAEVRALMATEAPLDEAFGRLNGETLYPAAIKEENTVRVYRTHQLYARLTRAE